MSTRATAADLRYMRECIALAREARASGDHPIGSLVVRSDVVLGRGIESTRRLQDVTAHAEVEALRAACREVGNLDLRDATLYTTVEPCYLCSYAIRQLRIARVVIGLAYPAAGGVSSRHPILSDAQITCWDAPPEIITDVLLDECNTLATATASTKPPAPV